MSFWSQVVIQLVLCLKWPQIPGQIVDSPIFTDTISISYTTITPSETIIIPSTASPNFCPPVPNISDGSHVYSTQNCDPITLGCTVDYSCNVGYTLVGSSSRECTIHGWEPGESSCEKITCEIPFLINGEFTPTDTVEYGDIVNFTCNTDYLLEGNETAICQADGSWSGNRTCTYVCPEPTLEFGTVNYTCITETCIVDFECDDGYVLSGDSRRRCIEGAGWSGLAPSCIQEDVESSNNFQLTFDAEVIDMEDPALEQEVHDQVYQEFEDVLGDKLKRVIVNRIYPNGTIDFTLVIEDTREAKQLLSSAFAGIARGHPFELQGVKGVSNRSVLNGKEALLADGSTIEDVNCETLEYLDGLCPIQTPCSVLDDIADCRAPVEKDDNLWLILLLSIGLPVLAIICAVVLCCCYCCCCAKPVADDESDDEPPPITVKGFLPRYLPWGMPVRFNNTGMQGPIYGYGGSDRFSTPPTTLFSRSSESSSDAASAFTGTSRGTHNSRRSRRNNRRYR